MVLRRAGSRGLGLPSRMLGVGVCGVGDGVGVAFAPFSLSSSAAALVELSVTGHASPSARGAPVFFLHGLLGSATNFRTLQMAAARTRPTFALDLRNHGRSPHAPDASLDALACDVAAAIEKAQPRRSETAATAPGATIVGHSLGGKVAMRLAQLRPDLVGGGVIVIDIAPVAYSGETNAGWKSVQGVVHAAAALNPSLYRTRGEVEAALALHVPEAGVRSFVAQNLVPAADGVYAWRVNFKNIIQSLPLYAGYPEDDVARRNPATALLDAHFIAGELSPYIAPAHAGAIFDLFPKAKTHVVKGAGHWVHADRPQEFWALLAVLLGCAV